jgi:hypothetical protein
MLTKAFKFVFDESLETWKFKDLLIFESLRSICFAPESYKEISVSDGVFTKVFKDLNYTVPRNGQQEIVEIFKAPNFGFEFHGTVVNKNQGSWNELHLCLSKRSNQTTGSGDFSANIKWYYKILQHKNSPNIFFFQFHKQEGPFNNSSSDKKDFETTYENFLSRQKFPLTKAPLMQFVDQLSKLYTKNQIDVNEGVLNFLQMNK